MILADLALVAGILIGIYGPETWDLRPLFLLLVLVYAVALCAYHGHGKDHT